jgi:hypothetical protein
MMKLRESNTATSLKRSDPKRRSVGVTARVVVTEEEVPLQVMVPERVRRQVRLICAERGENLRTLVLRGLQSVGVDVPDTELVDRRGRRRG